MNIGYQDLVIHLWNLVVKREPGKRVAAMNMVALAGFMAAFVVVVMALWFLADSTWMWVVVAASLLAYTVLFFACLEVLDMLQADGTFKEEAAP